MRKVTIFLTAIATVVASTFFASPASAEFEPPQRSAWGLAGPESTSNSVATFSALGFSVEESNGFMFVGGKFQNVTNGAQSVNQPNFARFDLNGVWDSGFTPAVSRPVLSIADSPDGGLFLGGEVRTYNGANVGSLTKINPQTGNIWPGWNLKVTGGTNVVREVTIEEDGWAYAVGTFKDVRYNGVVTPVTNIFRFNPATGEPDTTWLPVVTGGSIWDVSVSKTNNSVYVAGWYDSVAGSTRAAVGIDANDATVLTWDSFENNQSARVQYGVEATEFGHVWVVGEQHGVWVHDENANYEVIKDHVTNCHSAIQGGCNRRGGAYQEIERVGNRIYATCHCWGYHATGSGPNPQPYPGNLVNTDNNPNWELTGSVSGIVAYDVATGERDQSFNPYMAGDIGGFGIAQASDGCLWTTGGYNAVGNPADGPQTPGRDLVRLCDEGDVEPLEAPATCAAVENGANIDVSWPAANGAAEYIIRRSVNGGTQHWQGRVSGTTFTNNNRAGTLQYYVESKSAAGELSSRTACSFEEDNNNQDPTPVASCSATANAAGTQATVTWPAVDGATKYVVYRTVNNSPQYWQGAVDAPAVSFSNGLRAGEIEYFVSAKFGNEFTTAVACTPVL